MTDITIPVKFSDDANSRIKSVKARPTHDHRDWGCDELEKVRCEARDHYRAVQRHVCAYCHQIVSQRSAAGATVEHIACRSVYPQFMFEPKNLCVVCPDCNEFKRAREALADPTIIAKNPKRYPKKSESFRIYHPHFDVYSDHIKRAGILYLTPTAKGAYTAYVCHFSRFIEAIGITDELLQDLGTLVERHRFHDR